MTTKPIDPVISVIEAEVRSRVGSYTLRRNGSLEIVGRKLSIGINVRTCNYVCRAQRPRR